MRAARLWKRMTASSDVAAIRAFAVYARVAGRSRFAMKRHLDAVLRKLETLSNERPVISHEAFLEICGGICGEGKSERLAAMCYRGGYVLRFERSVYTSRRCAATALSQLSLNRGRLLSLLNGINTELAQSHRRKYQLDWIAYVGTRRLFLVGLMTVVFQLLFFFRLTFVELSWDIMEPTAYLTTMFLGVTSYGYYLLTYKRPKYAQVKQRLLETRRAMLYEKAGFDIIRHRLLEQRAALYEGYLRAKEKPSSRVDNASN